MTIQLQPRRQHLSDRYTNSRRLLIPRGHDQPDHKGLCSCKQSKSKQEQDEKQSEIANRRYEDHPGFQLTQGLIRFQGRIWVGANVGLQTKLIQSFHSSPVGGHSGVHATYQHLKKLFYWKGINQAVEDFLKQCCICQQAKHEHCKSPGLLSPLPIPF